MVSHQGIILFFISSYLSHSLFSLSFVFMGSQETMTKGNSIIQLSNYPIIQLSNYSIIQLFNYSIIYSNRQPESLSKKLFWIKLQIGETKRKETRIMNHEKRKKGKKGKIERGGCHSQPVAGLISDIQVFPFFFSSFSSFSSFLFPLLFLFFSSFPLFLLLSFPSPPPLSLCRRNHKRLPNRKNFFDLAN